MRTILTSIKATVVVGTAKVLSHKDIVRLQQQRDIKDAEAVTVRGRRTSKRSTLVPFQAIGKRPRRRSNE